MCVKLDKKKPHKLDPFSIFGKGHQLYHYNDVDSKAGEKISKRYISEESLYSALDTLKEVNEKIKAFQEKWAEIKIQSSNLFKDRNEKIQYSKRTKTPSKDIRSVLKDLQNRAQTDFNRCQTASKNPRRYTKDRSQDAFLCGFWLLHHRGRLWWHHPLYTLRTSTPRPELARTRGMPQHTKNPLCKVQPYARPQCGAGGPQCRSMRSCRAGGATRGGRKAHSIRSRTCVAEISVPLRCGVVLQADERGRPKKPHFQGLFQPLRASCGTLPAPLAHCLLPRVSAGDTPPRSGPSWRPSQSSAPRPPAGSATKLPDQLGELQFRYPGAGS